MCIVMLTIHLSHTNILIQVMVLSVVTDMCIVMLTIHLSHTSILIQVMVLSVVTDMCIVMLTIHLSHTNILILLHRVILLSLLYLESYVSSILPKYECHKSYIRGIDLSSILPRSSQ